MKRLIALLACLTLAGCFTAGRRGDTAMETYDLGAVPAATATGLPPLALEVTAPAWLDGPGISYRLAYAEPGRLRDYARARWAAPPAILVKQQLVRQLGLIPAGQGGAACLLRVDMDEFSQIFGSPDGSKGVLQARLSVLDRGRNIRGSHLVQIEKPAPSQDSRGGVAALTATVAQLAEDVGRWQGELAAAGKLKGCEGK